MNIHPDNHEAATAVALTRLADAVEFYAQGYPPASSREGQGTAELWMKVHEEGLTQVAEAIREGLGDVATAIAGSTRCPVHCAAMGC